MAPLQDELKKRGPFDSVEQEAALAIMRTSDLLENRIARMLREYNLTSSQYNVLRILRGEGRPIPVLEVAQRMIQVAPAITRIVDQLLTLDLIKKVQSEQDRRVFTVELKPAAKTLLAKLDQPIIDFHTALLKGIKKSDLKTLIQTLELARSAIGR